MTRNDVVAKRHPVYITALLITLVTGLASCGIVGSDYVPTEETFRKHAGTFLIDAATNVQPIYANVDVDSVFGRYAVAGTLSDALMEIEQRASRDGWILFRRDRMTFEFHKAVNGTNQSLEITRVIWRESPASIYVAWVQIDGATAFADAAKSAEGKWAVHEFWPFVERTVASQRP